MSTDSQAKPVRIRILRNFTVEHIEPELKSVGADLGVSLSVEIGGFDTIQQDLLREDPAAVDVLVVLIHLDHFCGGMWTPDWELATARKGLLEIFGLLEQQTASRIIINSFVVSGVAWLPQFGSADYSGRAQAVRELNVMVREFVAEHPQSISLLDCEALASRLGADAALDLRYGFMMKAPFRQMMLRAMATDILRLAACLRRPPKKVVVLDCDNTLWGGVVGEDGMDGIQLHPFEFPGVVYHRFQFTLLMLREQGVLLCLCSKNNEANVWEVLDDHPHALLRRNHLTGWRINWTDKATNIAELAKDLNLGLSSFVFVDDDPRECSRVQESLPEVTVLQVPEHKYRLPDLLPQSRLFDSLGITEDDRQRAQRYADDRQRAEARSSFPSVDEYLETLRIEITVRPPRLDEMPRATQLSQRTNQFNLTTRRYTEAELAAFSKAAGSEVYGLWVTDKFGSLGMVGLMTVHVKDGLADIENLLMSCRVIGRKIEAAFVSHGLTDLFGRHQVKRVRAAYVPTPKNDIVADLWPRFGLEPKGGSTAGQGFESECGALRLETPRFISVASSEHDE